ncbi:DUF4992 family lipoprotein [Palleniella muris]|uniref:DUF4992 family lipoprotein n=1 Tax=Palleniella muris TaxID=3038145 RepID=UPI003BB19D4D
MEFLQRKTWLVVCIFSGVICLSLCACADCYESPSGFDVGVSNAQLENPNADSISFIVDASVTSATIKWPLVNGAVGYVVTGEGPALCHRVRQ